MNILATMGSPKDANLVALTDAARKAWGDLFEIRAHYDPAIDAVLIRCSHGNSIYTQSISRQVFGDAPILRSAQLMASPANIAVGNVQVTEWAIGEAIRGLSEQMGPVKHIIGRMENAEKSLHNAVVEAEYRKKMEGLERNDRERLQAIITGFWSLPWYKRVWYALIDEVQGQVRSPVRGGFHATDISTER